MANAVPEMLLSPRYKCTREGQSSNLINEITKCRLVNKPPPL